MKSVADLSDAEIDGLLLGLFNASVPSPRRSLPNSRTSRVQELSDEDLLRIRSKNHPDKWPNTNQSAYQAAVEELDRRRRLKK